MSVARVIKMTLSVDSIENAIKEVTAYRDSIALKANELTEKLAEIGVDEASVRFTTARNTLRNIRTLCWIILY